MKKLLAIICSFLLLVSGAALFTACGNTITIPYPNPEGEEAYVIKVGVTNYEPMDYKDENGQWIGFDADLAKKAFNELGYDVTYVEIDWDFKVTSLDSGEIDVIWNGMTITDELREKVALTDPYLTNQQVIVVKTENLSKFETTADLSNATSIVFEKGSAAETELEKLSLDENKLLGASKQLDAFFEVNAGASEVAVVDKTMAQSLCGTGSYTGLSYKEIGFEPEYFAAGFRKSDSEMAERINTLLAKYAQDGTIDALKAKYGITL